MLNALKELEKRRHESSAPPPKPAPQKPTQEPQAAESVPAAPADDSALAFDAPASECDWIRVEGGADAVNPPAAIADELAPPASWEFAASGDWPAPSRHDVASQIVQTTEELAARIRDQLRDEETLAAQPTSADRPSTAEDAEDPASPKADVHDGEPEIRIVPFTNAVATLDPSQRAPAAGGNVSQLPIDVDSLKFYRELASRLMSRLDPDFHTLALVALSAAAHEQFCSSNLAISFGEQDAQPVLLLTNTHERLRGSRPERRAQPAGWADALLGLARWDEVIQPTAAPGVSIAARGKAPLEFHDHPAGFAELRDDFRLVIIDAGVATDEGAAWLAAHASSAYALVELGQMRRNAARDALADLEAAGVHIDGVLALDATMRSR
jgi:hypothetical protein